MKIKPKIIVADRIITSFRQALWEMGINASQFAKMTGQPSRTVYDWAVGKYDPPPVVFWGISLYLKTKRRNKNGTRN